MGSGPASSLVERCGPPSRGRGGVGLGARPCTRPYTCGVPSIARVRSWTCWFKPSGKSGRLASYPAPALRHADRPSSIRQSKSSLSGGDGGWAAHLEATPLGRLVQTDRAVIEPSEPRRILAPEPTSCSILLTAPPYHPSFFQAVQRGGGAMRR